MINKILYKSVGLGGTFDHFHDGHKSFIRYAASFSRELIIGVTTKKMTLSKPFNKTIKLAWSRSKAVKNFCFQEGINAKIIELNDIFGPTIEPKTVQAIACTTDTASGANKINEVRSKMSMRELPIHVHKLLLKKNLVQSILLELDQVKLIVRAMSMPKFWTKIYILMRLKEIILQNLKEN